MVSFGCCFVPNIWSTVKSIFYALGSMCQMALGGNIDCRTASVCMGMVGLKTEEHVGLIFWKRKRELGAEGWIGRVGFKRSTGKIAALIVTKGRRQHWLSHLRIMQNSCVLSAEAIALCIIFVAVVTSVNSTFAPRVCKNQRWELWHCSCKPTLIRSGFPTQSWSK